MHGHLLSLVSVYLACQLASGCSGNDMTSVKAQLQLIKYVANPAIPSTLQQQLKRLDVEQRTEPAKPVQSCHIPNASCICATYFVNQLKGNTLLSELAFFYNGGFY